MKKENPGTHKEQQRDPGGPSDSQAPPAGSRPMTPDELAHFEEDIVQGDDRPDPDPPPLPSPD